MRKIIILTFILISVRSFSQIKNRIYKTEGHNNSTTYSYFVNTLSLDNDMKYVMTIQEYLSKKLMKKNIVNNFTKLRGSYIKKGDTLILIEKKESFLYIKKNKLMKLIDGKYKTKYFWGKINH